MTRQEMLADWVVQAAIKIYTARYDTRDGPAFWRKQAAGEAIKLLTQLGEPTEEVES